MQKERPAPTPAPDNPPAFLKTHHHVRKTQIRKEVRTMKIIQRMNLTNAPQIKTDKKDREYATFGGAANIWKQQDGKPVQTDEVRFFSVTAYEHLDEVKALGKGDYVELIGYCESKDYTTKDGQEKTINFFTLKSLKVIKKKTEKKAA